MELQLSSFSERYYIVQHPSIMLSAVAYYLFVVYGFYNRVFSFSYIKPFLFVHNVLSVGFSVYLFVGILHTITQEGFRLYGNSLERSDKMTHYLWFFHMTKYYEFIDTLIMILRNSYRQITFLHVYHHVSVVLYTWLILYNHPGGDFYLGPLLNSWVHMWMYIYYLLSGLLTKSQRQRYLWWNQYLTKLQILQFFINLVHSIYSMLYSPYTTPLYRIGLYHQISFIILFGHFYLKKYNKNKLQ